MTGRKEKTKAKKRYLKAKKDRRKKRKTGPDTPGKGPSDHAGDGEDEPEEDISIEDVVVAEPVEAGPSSKPPKRPKKRRKVEEGETLPDSVEPDEAPPEVLSQPPLPVQPAKAVPIPSNPDALPSFPAPRRPDAPSKATLALQGLDKALIEAELVNPSKVLPITDEEEGAAGLSHRTRKRLRELGITELFAGMFYMPSCYVVVLMV